MNRLLMIPLAAAIAVTAGCTTSRDSYRDDYGYYDRAYYDQNGRYDYNNPDPRYGGYYADNYYRQDRRYRSRELGNNDRVYRGRDGRYYCRRSDGRTAAIAPASWAITTGSIAGATGATTAAGRMARPDWWSALWSAVSSGTSSRRAVPRPLEQSSVQSAVQPQEPQSTVRADRARAANNREAPVEAA